MAFKNFSPITLLKIQRATMVICSFLNQFEYSSQRGHGINLLTCMRVIVPRLLMSRETRGTAGRRSPALIHKWNNLTVCYAGLIPTASPSS